jgi:hypothetical protein
MGSRNAARLVYSAPHVLFLRFFPLFLDQSVTTQTELDFARFLPLLHRATVLLDDRVQEPSLGFGSPFGVPLIELSEYLVQLDPVDLLILLCDHILFELRERDENRPHHFAGGR